MKLLRSLSICVLAVVTVGSVLAQQVRTFQSDGPMPKGRVVVKGGGKYVEHLTKTLNLTPAQVKKVEVQYAAFMKKLTTSGGPGKFEAIFNWNKAEMKKILTPEQYKKFEATNKFKMKPTSERRIISNGG